MNHIGVVGCGTMGSGIALSCALQGIDVSVVEDSSTTVDLGKMRLEASLERVAKSRSMNESQRIETLSLIRYSTELSSLSTCGLVIEAIAEDLPAKEEVFRSLDRIVSKSAVLASNTSSIPIMKLARCTTSPERVIGMHFFNPVPVLHLVEVVSSLLTSKDTRDLVANFATDVLKKQVVYSKDRAGFIVNALLLPYLLGAIRMYEGGFATAENIDTAMVVGCAHPIGPLALCDLIGLDIAKAVADSIYEEFKDPSFAPPALLLRMVEAGHLGRKTGKGFYQYP